MIHDADRQKIIRQRIITSGFLSLVALLLIYLFNPAGTLEYSAAMQEASELMASVTNKIGAFRSASETGIDERVDPNRTGLIGPSLSNLMTTVGHLEAKRTATNPNMAGLMVYLLERAGVARGDTIAVGCSASFPSLLIAVLAAADVLEVQPDVIISLGASSYGATAPEFNLFDIYQLLLEWNLIETGPAAVSLGGGRDIGEEFDPASRDLLIQQIRSSELLLIEEPDLQSNVAKRMQIYESMRGRERISAFVNIGGGYANLGVSALVLRVKPGINHRVQMPPPEQRGVIHDMASRGIPVIHLLNIRDLASRYGLTWDPVPLPSPQSAYLSIPGSSRGVFFCFITILYLAVLLWLMMPIIRFERQGSLYYYRN